jgi:hypothetical protein
MVSMLLIQEDAIWSVSHQKFTFLGDTMINDLNYKKLYYHDSIPDFTPEKLKYVAAIREANEDSKVWMIFRNTDTEKLLYDFSLLPGDKSLITTLYLFFDYEWSDSFVEQEIEILSVDEVLIDGELRKKLVLKSKFTEWENEYWIEGIGSSSGVVYPGNSFSIFGIADFGYPNLLCFAINDILIFQNEFYESCFQGPTNVNIREERTNPHYILAKRINYNTLQITGNHYFKTLEVFDISGRKIFQEKLTDLSVEHYLDIGYLKNGVYMIRAYSVKEMSTIKFLKIN